MATQNILNLSLSGQSGTGSFAGTTSPSFTTPSLDAATITSINKLLITAPGTSATVTIADNKTFTASNTLTFTGTDSSSIAFGTGGTAAYDSGFTAWTPSFTFATPGDLSVSYAVQVGSYVKIGSTVTAIVSLQFTPTFTTSSGAGTITGWPFAPRAASNHIATGPYYISTSHAWTVNYTHLSWRFANGATITQLQESGTGVSNSNFTTTQLVSGTQVTVNGSITYITA